MSDIELIREDIAKNRIALAFEKTKQLIKSMANRRVSRKLLDSVQFLEYQYNHIDSSSREILSAEQSIVFKNRVVLGVFPILTEIELLSVTLTPSRRKLKKFQLVAEDGLYVANKRLSEEEKKRASQKLSEPSPAENYLIEKIERLEKINKRIIRANKAFAVPVSLYFIVQMVQMYIKWDHEHHRSDSLGGSTHQDGDDFLGEAVMQHLLLAGAYDHDQDDAGGQGYQAMDFDNDDTSDGSDSGDPGGGGDD